MANDFEQAMGICDDAKLAANWVQGDLSAQLNRDNHDIATNPVNAEQLGRLLVRVKDETINGKAAKQVFQSPWNGEGTTADELIEKHGRK